MPGEKRSPRFRRVKVPGFRITSRDLAIVRAVYEHRLLSSDHIVGLLGDGSRQQILRRLRLLYHGRYLDRPRVQLADLYEQPGTRPMVYGLGDKGADLLAEQAGLKRSAVSWTAKNRAIRSRFFHHTLLVSGIMVAFEVACREAGNVRVIPWDEILAGKCPEETRDLKHPRTWRVPVPRHGSIGVTPDNIFGLEFLDRPEGQRQTFFFLEADRGTMPVLRKNLKTTSFYRKLVAYHATFTQSIHTKRFGFKAFRVLTVTTGQKRVTSMVNAAQKLEGLQGMFLFADHGAVTQARPLAIDWRTGRGDRGRLVS